MNSKSNDSLLSLITGHCENHDDGALKFEELDLSASVQLPQVPRTFTYGAKFTEKDWDGNIVDNCDKSDEQTQANEFEAKSPGGPGISEVIPPSPVISSSSRRGSRKHERLKSKRNSNIMNLPQPLFSPQVNTINSPRLSDVDTPPCRKSGDLDTPQCSRLAASLGCDPSSPAWMSSMETPGSGDVKDRSVLTTVERRELLPSADVEIQSPDCRNSSSGGNEKKFEPKTLFKFDDGDTSTETAPNVLNVKRDELVELDSDEDEQEHEKSLMNSSNGNTSKQNSQEKILQSIENRNNEGLKRKESEGFKEVKRKLEDESHQSNKVMKTEWSDDRQQEQEFVGFKTGLGKLISISESALAEAKSKLGLDQGTSGPTDVGAVPSKLSSVSDSSLQKQVKPTDLNEGKSTNFVGFKTASGSSVKISSEALETAKMKMKSLLPKDDFSNENFVGFQTAAGKGINISKDALVKAESKLQSILPGPDQQVQGSREEFAGFRTATGKTIDISKEAIEKAQNKLNSFLDDCKGDGNEVKKFEDQKFVGFQTAKGKDIKVSEEAFEMAKTKISGFIKSDDKKEPLQNGINVTPVNHRTSSNKAFKKVIPRNLNASTKKEPQNVQSKEAQFKDNPIVLNGFQTASGSSIKVSEKSLKDAASKLSTVEDNHSKVVTGMEDNEDEFWFDSEDDKWLMMVNDNVEERRPPPYTCKPSDISFKKSPYRCHPNFFDKSHPAKVGEDFNKMPKIEESHSLSTNAKPHVSNIATPSFHTQEETAPNNKSDSKMQQSEQNAKNRLKLLEKDISYNHLQLKRQGLRLGASPNVSSSPVSRAVRTPFKPPKISFPVSENKDADSINSQEFEKYALEFVEELNV